MKQIRFYILGVVFGIIMTKAQVVSWFRIYEMFTFQSFHMYGVIGAAVGVGVLIVLFIKKSGLKSTEGEQIVLAPKAKTVARYLIGGSIFGFGWALTGACPGPMFTLLGYGYLSMIAVIASAVLGTFVYGLIRDKLPH